MALKNQPAPAAKSAVANQATAAPAKPSAAPGTKEPKAKKEKVERVDYPIVAGTEWSVTTGEGDAAVTKLTAWPTDHDPKVHKPLTRKDFADEAVFYDVQADRLERQAKKFRDKAAETRTLGNVKERVKAKKLIAAMKRMEDMKAELVASGVDLEALMKSLQESKAEA